MLRSDLKTPSAPALERGLKLLEILANSGRGLTLSELVRRLGLPKSSIHCLLLTLERHGYLRQCTRTHRFMFSTKMCGLVNYALTQIEIRQVAAPHLQELMQQTGLTVHLGVLEHDEVVLVGKTESPGMLKVASWIGRRMDIHCTGLGKALIAYLEDSELDRLIKEHGLPRHNENTISSARALKMELTAIRKLKYALDDEEDEVGLRCLGSPILDHSGKALAAISICGTVSHITENNLSALAKTLIKTASEISENMGAVGL